MSKNSNIMTNEELQQGLSNKLREFDAGTKDNGSTKTYYIGARTLLSAVKMDMDGAKKLELPLFNRTKSFLGVME